MNTSFQALLAQSTKDTARSQIQLQATLKAKQEAARRAQDELDRKERERLADVAQRRREREERERLEKEKAEKAKLLQPLPKTRNLWELKQERRKRGLDEDGKDDHLVGRVEANKMASSTNSSSSSAPKTYKELMKAASKIAPSAMRTNPKSASSSQKLPLTREEKAAKRRNDLFKADSDDDGSGSMALARNRSLPTISSMPTPRLLSPAPSTSQGLKSTSTSRPSTSNGTQISRSSSSSAAASSSKKPTGKPSKTIGFDPKKFVRLNQDKRDLRTIEEIERDMKERKMAKAGNDGNSNVSKKISANDKIKSESKASTSTVSNSTMISSPKRIEGKRPELPRANSSSRSIPKSEANRPELQKPHSSLKIQQSKTEGKRPELPRSTSSTQSIPKASGLAKRRRSPSSSFESESDSEVEDRYKSKKKKNKDVLGHDLRSEIWALLGRDRSKDLSRPAYSSDDDSDAMEVPMMQLEAEERKALRDSIREDKEEEERLRIAAERKRLAKLAKGK